MTILTALTHLYDRMLDAGEAPKLGFSTEKISFELVFDKDGKALRLSSLQNLSGKKPAPRIMSVPAAVKRSSGIKPNLFWDKTAYVFGSIAAENEEGHIVAGIGRRTADEHAAFVKAHLEILAETEDEGLLAFKRYLQNWRSELFAELGYSVDALDENIVFRLEGDKGPDGASRFLHDRPAVLPLLTSGNREGDEKGLCLVTGNVGPIARLHPSIKGVKDAQSAGAALVSFNGEPYESFGNTQGDNAPVSEYAAFAYGAALNALLAKGSTRRTRVADTTVAFWSEAKTTEASISVDSLMSLVLNPPSEQDEVNKLRAAIESVARGRHAEAPQFDPETKVYLLGLAPNAARLSVRFWYPGSLGDFAANITQFWQDLEIHPSPFKGSPTVWALLYETAFLGKAENIPPLLGGNVMRSVLEGKPLPRTLLSAVIRRIRADGDVNGRRVAICKAVVNRTTKEVLPVSLDLENINPAYRLGRLFALLESAQSAALPGINATIKDKFFAAASATPARVFPLLIKNSTHHLASLKKGGGGLGHWMEKEIGEVWLGLDADMPRSLSLEDQGRFCAGYYHQRWTKKETIEIAEKEIDDA